MKFDAKIVEIGEMVEELIGDLNTLIIFNEGLSEELLKEISVLHSVCELVEDVVVGDIFTIGDNRFEVTAIGDLALKTLREIGHCTIKFDGLNKADLPGEIQVKGNLRSFDVGDRLAFFSENQYKEA